MANLCVLLTALAAAVLLTAASANNPRTIGTAYNMLQQYGFPPGIIPEGVQSYELRQDGSFEVHLSNECGLHIGGFKLHYSSRIAGNIHNGWITGLEGVKVKIAMAWVGIRKVSRDGNQLRVGAGRITKSFPIGDFSTSPHC
uniref:Uncharacterized protein n=1 Tax=Avena sativa TaxID=4498 RepID=A0ACD5YFD9_AVESA